MGTVEKRDKHKKRGFVSPEEKLERELKDCMHCRFFWGHNNRCANGTCCKPSKKKEQKNEMTSTYKKCEKEVQSLNRKLENLNQYLSQTQANPVQEQQTKNKNHSL